MAKKPPFPTKQEIVEFIESQETTLSRGEIFRAFNVKNADRTRLRLLLKELESQGLLSKSKKKYQRPSLPDVLTVIIQDVRDDGTLIARPESSADGSTRVLIHDRQNKRGKPSLGVGDRVLVRVRLLKDTRVFDGKILKPLGKKTDKIYGFVRGSSRGLVVMPTDKKANKLFPILSSSSLKVKKGDFISGHLDSRRGRGLYFVPEKILGHESDPHIISGIAIHAQGLKEKFSPQALQLAEKASLPALGKREDLRSLSLVTIDGEDARDFDDAVYAEQDGAGWHLVVAIADVAFYVRSGDELDKEALERGNSTYFPDRVLPMLPEALSNGLCSLKPNEDRACLAVHLWIDQTGVLKKYKFVRGLMCSRARLTYTQVQKALDGEKSDLSEEFIQSTLTPLFKAYQCLKAARESRGALDFDRDEPKIILDKDQNPIGIDVNERHESHKIIEEFMITANVAAARTLEEKGAPCLYRVHETPDPAKVIDLRESLKGLGIPAPKVQSQDLKPRFFSDILEKARGLPVEHLVNELVLRTQSKAFYSPKNIGHFGLGLSQYAHFTSPIRRYADLVVHRSLILTLHLGDGALSSSIDVPRLETVAERISTTERTSDRAAWDTIERFQALYLRQYLNKTLTGRIDGVGSAGLFVEIEDLGAVGLVPMSSLKSDFYTHDPVHHRLVGRHSNTTYTLGDSVKVIVKEANPVTRGIILRLT